MDDEKNPGVIEQNPNNGDADAETPETPEGETPENGDEPTGVEGDGPDAPAGEADGASDE